MSDQAEIRPEASGPGEGSAPAAEARLGAGPSTEPFDKLRVPSDVEGLRAGWVVVSALALTGLAALGALWIRDRARAGRAPAPETLRSRLDINKASAAELDNLPGVGGIRAARLVEERRLRGGFKRMSELEEPNLLGPGASARLAPYVLPLPGDEDAGRR